MAILATDVSERPSITLKNPTLIRDVQESSSSFGMQFTVKAGPRGDAYK